MKYVLVLLALFATLIGVRGDTWDRKAVGWRRLTGMGWAAVVIAVLAAISSVWLEYEERSVLSEKARRAEWRRLDGLAQMAAHAWNLEFLRTVARELDSRPELRELAQNRLEMGTKTAAHSLRIYADALNREERLVAENLVTAAEITLAGLSTSRPIVKGADLMRFAETARDARRRFCEPILQADEFCKILEKTDREPR